MANSPTSDKIKQLNDMLGVIGDLTPPSTPEISDSEMDLEDSDFQPPPEPIWDMDGVVAAEVVIQKETDEAWVAIGVFIYVALCHIFFRCDMYCYCALAHIVAGINALVLLLVLLKGLYVYCSFAWRDCVLITYYYVSVWLCALCAFCYVYFTISFVVKHSWLFVHFCCAWLPLLSSGVLCERCSTTNRIVNKCADWSTLPVRLHCGSSMQQHDGCNRIRPYAAMHQSHFR